MATTTVSPNFGKASAAKRGRNPRFPYVPVIDYGEQATGVHATRTEQVKGKAFASRPEAVAYAQRVIDGRAALHEEHLVTPRYRALREQYGLPRELPGVQVESRPDGDGQVMVGVVVAATAQEREQGRADLGLGLGSDEFDDCSLVEWPVGRRWERPGTIRVHRG